MMEVKETIHPTNISHQHPNPMTSIFLLWLILLLLEFRILPQLRKTPCTLGIYQWKLGVRFRTTNQNISFVSSEIFASFLSWIHFWWVFFFFFHQQCGCLDFSGEITVLSIFLCLKLPLLLCLVLLFLIIRRLYHQLYSYYLVYVSPKLRERESERERSKLLVKRLEEGQVQKKKKRKKEKRKKDFEMTQCPTVFTLSMTRANTLSMEQ